MDKFLLYHNSLNLVPITNSLLPRSVEHLEDNQTSKMELFTKIVNGWKPFNIFEKRSIFDWVMNVPLTLLHIWRTVLNPLSANIIKWSNTLKQFVGKLPTNCLSVFDHFVGLALKGLKRNCWYSPHSHQVCQLWDDPVTYLSGESSFIYGWWWNLDQS